VTNWPALDVAIRLAFLYFLLSVVCSSANEAIASDLSSVVVATSTKQQVT
jgi:hypothetical protein